MIKRPDYMINEFMNECFDTFNATYAHLLDTEDYVPSKYNEKRRAFIFKQERKAWRRLKRFVKSMRRYVVTPTENAAPTENVTST